MTLEKSLRQRIRKALLILAALLFPITLNYFSPYLIIDGAMNGVVNGSFLSFAAMFVSSLFFGRLWCGWGCPGGGVGEIAFAVNNRPVGGRHKDKIKWLIWIPWMLLIAGMAFSAGGYRQVDFFYQTEGGISVAGAPDRPIMAAYIIYYLVVGTFLVLSILAGRRAGCHAICWMAPFMILGRKLRNLFQWPALRLKANPETCKDCKKCTDNCPMSLDVNGMVQAGSMENSECILCGSCVDTCPQRVIRYSFSSGK